MKQKNYSSASIVIPNWNGAHLLSKNLPAVLAACPDCEIIVADDASTDTSLSILRKNFPNVIIVANQLQHGFSSNVNSGVARATGEVVVLLNTDVRPEKDFLAPLLAHFQNASVFGVGCLEKSYEASSIVSRGRGQAKWEKGYFIHNRGEVDRSDTAWVSGGSSAFRKDMWNRLGGMDTMFNPFYWEDIDLSYRAQKAGWTVLFEPKSVVGHFHDEGKIKTSYSAGLVKRIVYRNQFIFIWKNISNVRLCIAHAFWTPIRLLQSIVHGDIYMIQGYVWALWMIPLILKCRHRASQLWYKDDLILFH